MHGGAKGSGAPPGNQNALKHGLYTRQAFEERKAVSRLIRDSKKLFEEIE
jgi:glucans biosynthesis protein